MTTLRTGCNFGYLYEIQNRFTEVVPVSDVGSIHQKARAEEGRMNYWPQGGRRHDDHVRRCWHRGRVPPDAGPQKGTLIACRPSAPKGCTSSSFAVVLGCHTPEAHGDLLERSGTVVGFGGSIVDNTFAEVTDMCGLGSPYSHGVARSSISLDGPRTLMEGHVDTGIEHVLDLYLGHQVVWDLSIGVVNSA